ncbi:MAG: hypothetical protein ACOCSC_01405 [Candidatus Hadarchaeota archaeon]
MLDDKDRKKPWLIIALIILASIIIFPILLDQTSSGTEGGDPGSLDKTTTPNTAPESTSDSTSTPQSDSQDTVRFTVYVDESNIQDCGLTCREVPATLKNTGEEAAHNVDVDVRFYCNGDRIDINGQEYISLDLGTLEPGESKTRTEEIDVGWGGGLCIQNNGARIVFTVTSDEKTMTLEETYNP